jgi:Anti-sigma factor NepR
MSDAQDANRCMGEVVRLSEARGSARASAFDRFALAAITRGLRNTYAELLKEPLPKRLTDLVFQLHQAQEARRPNGS